MDERASYAKPLKIPSSNSRGCYDVEADGVADRHEVEFDGDLHGQHSIGQRQAIIEHNG